MGPSVPPVRPAGQPKKLHGRPDQPPKPYALPPHPLRSETRSAPIFENRRRKKGAPGSCWLWERPGPNFQLAAPKSPFLLWPPQRKKKKNLAPRGGVGARLPPANQSPGPLPDLRPKGEISGWCHRPGPPPRPAKPLVGPWARPHGPPVRRACGLRPARPGALCPLALEFTGPACRPAASDQIGPVERPPFAPVPPSPPAGWAGPHRNPVAGNWRPCHQPFAEN